MPGKIGEAIVLDYPDAVAAFFHIFLKLLFLYPRRGARSRDTQKPFTPVADG